MVFSHQTALAADEPAHNQLCIELAGTFMDVLKPRPR